jgi:hypothetical protein
MTTTKPKRAKVPTVAAPRKKLEAKFSESKDTARAEALAKLATRPSANAAMVMAAYTKPLGVGDEELGELVASLAESAEKLQGGDLSRCEAMLFGQAHALQSIFMNLARRATSQEYLKQWEAYLRMAMKAQNQCRMTLETLATIKNPPVVYAKQANINNGGQQQVNNGAAAAIPTTHAANPAAKKTELLEASDGQGLDTGTQSQAGCHRPAYWSQLMIGV